MTCRSESTMYEPVSLLLITMIAVRPNYTEDPRRPIPMYMYPLDNHVLSVASPGLLEPPTILGNLSYTFNLARALMTKHGACSHREACACECFDGILQRSATRSC